VLYNSFLNRSGGRRRQRLALGLVSATLLVFATTASRAGTLDVVVENTFAAPATAGQFDIDLVNNSASAVTVGAFSVDVTIPDATIVSFVGVDTNTIAPYIFSITGSFGFQITTFTPMEAAGNDAALSGGQVVNPGETWGLAHVRYVVDPSATPGTVVPVTLQPFPGTGLSDPTGSTIPANLVNGTITIQGPTVPEPSTLALLVTSGSMLLLASGRRRRIARGS
jgi:hypothetical protein